MLRDGAGVSARSYEDENAKAGKTYYYKVKAIGSSSGSHSEYSEVVSRKCDLKRPSVSISRNSSGYPSLKWSEISGAEKYYIYRAISKDGTYKKIKTTTSEKFVDKDVSFGKTYYYKVKAIHEDTDANSAYSSIDSIKAFKPSSGTPTGTPV